MQSSVQYKATQAKVVELFYETFKPCHLRGSSNVPLWVDLQFLGASQIREQLLHLLVGGLGRHVGHLDQRNFSFVSHLSLPHRDG